MIGFKRIGLEDKVWMNELIATADKASCSQNFTNLFIWVDTYNHLVARINDYLVVKGSLGNVKRYLFPTGCGDIRPVIEAMMQDALDCGHEFVMVGLLPEDAALLEKLYKDSFEFKKWRDGFDYVYLWKSWYCCRAENSMRNEIISTFLLKTTTGPLSR